MNFGFLASKPEYALFSDACIEAERTFTTSPAMCVVVCRKALELAVKWVYAADETMKEPYRDNLQSLLHEPTFRFAVNRTVWSRLPLLVKMGNASVHTNKKLLPQDAVIALRSLFDFVQWLDYCYGSAYEQRAFDERKIPAVKLALDVKAIKQRESLLEQKDDEIRRLEEEVRRLRSQFATAKAEAADAEPFNPDEIPENETRRRYIDFDLRYAGWSEDAIETEVEVTGMPNSEGRD